MLTSEDGHGQHPIFHPRRDIIIDTRLCLRDNLNQTLAKIENRGDLTVDYHHAYFYDADQQSPIDVTSSEISTIRHWCTRLTKMSSFHIYIKAKKAGQNPMVMCAPQQAPQMYSAINDPAQNFQS